MRVAANTTETTHERGTEASFAEVGISWLTIEGLCTHVAGTVFAVPKGS
jgi:hypothetical protein